ncbi:MAG: TonB-dependent receptor [Niabella sp.]
MKKNYHFFFLKSGCRALHLTAFFCICLLCLGVTGAAQQNGLRQVKGKVTDQEGQPLSGVSVVVKNKAAGTTTDEQGTYVLAVSEMDSVLVFSIVGYTQQEIALGKRTVADAILQKDVTGLGAVVVVGYGTQKKVNLTGAVATISGDQLEHRPNLSTSAALQGLAPGVTVTSQTGSPGDDGGEIRIRGINSFGGSSSAPLVIVDGVPGAINDIDPNLIASISVLKDAASASIYGSRAANGVILITTKRGKDRIAVMYRGYVGKQQPTAIPKVTDGLTYMKVFNQANQNDNGYDIYSEEDIETFKEKYAEDPDNYDWQKAILTGNGVLHNHFVSLNANTGIIKVLPSLTYAEQNGIIRNTNFKRYIFRNNMDITPSEKFNIKFDISATVKNRLQIANESTIWNYLGRMPTNIPIRYGDLWSEGWVKINPVGYIEEGGNKKTNNIELIGNLSVNYKPARWLSITGLVAPRYVTTNAHSFIKPVMTYLEDGSEAGTAETYTSLTETSYRYFYGNYQLYATANKNFNEHGLSLTLGASRETYDRNYIMAYRQNFAYDDYEVIDAGADDATKNNAGNRTQWLLISGFGRFNYDFKGKYLFEANMRYDGTSRFIANNRWGAFPSFSLGWILTKEPFLASLKPVLSFLKLRGSWGKLGNQDISASYYPFTEVLSMGSVSMGGVIYQSAAQNSMSNPDLRWEETTVRGWGLDATLFNKWSFTFDWYDKKTNGILLQLNTSQLTGLTAPYQNAGVVTNKGWELSTNYNDKWRDFKLGIGFNLSDVKNRIVDIKGQTSGTLLRQQAGYAINSIYGYIADGLYQSQEEIDAGPTQIGTLQPGDIRYKDIAGAFDDNGNPIADGQITDDDKVIIGSTIPRYTYGFNLNLGWKGISLGGFLQGVGKADGYLSSHYVIPLVNSSAVKEWQLDYWTSENTDASLPRPSITSTNNTQNSSFWMRSASYLRLKNIQLGYELPGNFLKRTGLKGVFVYLNGQNVFTKTRFYQGYDPEINYNADATDGVSLGDGNYYPQVKTYTFGIDIKF